MEKRMWYDIYKIPNNVLFDYTIDVITHSPNEISFPLIDSLELALKHIKLYVMKKPLETECIKSEEYLKTDKIPPEHFIWTL